MPVNQAYIRSRSEVTQQSLGKSLIFIQAMDNIHDRLSQVVGFGL